MDLEAVIEEGKNQVSLVNSRIQELHMELNAAMTWKETILASLEPLVLQSNRAMNEDKLCRSPFRNFVILSRLFQKLELETIKQLRQTCSHMKRIVDEVFYKSCHFVAHESHEFLLGVVLGPLNESLLNNIKRITFHEKIDLYDVARVIANCQNSLEELSIYSRKQFLTSEFHHVNRVIRFVPNLKTLRLYLPRNYLQFELFSEQLKTVTRLGVNFKQCSERCMETIFAAVPKIRYIEVTSSEHLEALLSFNRVKFIEAGLTADGCRLLEVKEVNLFVDRL